MVGRYILFGGCVDIVFGIIVSFVLGFFVGQKKNKIFQNDGERRLRSVVLENFKSPDYHLMNHITLKTEDGTTQIDHVLVSRFGIFVIETKNYNGWIFASPRSHFWMQVFFKRKLKFQNPVFQNFKHVCVIRELLEFMSPENIKSVVVFVGGAEFKMEMPEGVFDLEGFIRYIKNQKVEVVSINRLQFCVGRIEAARLAVTGETDIEHIEYLTRRYGGKM